ncbi:MAG: PEP-CTERM sorting domain-containing protein [Phenylobacterium sp.]|uniref:PEPxxWA-CTERM sorting domain-containing protein n=1 Tax=Phenylobacterium sp. TaxID=1871053 RepID=UPI001A47D2E5|nr:PEPxxWA-CTERM sorting domain-containing protein [Phenylobacterium sp.]MBL8554343.1 PEP-CTERM sorting domain-containing protein [Phenylobacterium sp.]
MLKWKSALVGASLAILAAGAAQAGVTPYDAPGVALSPAFGPLASGGELGANYIDFGIDFTYGGVEGYFDDGDIYEFGGVNSGNDVDLLSPVDGRIVQLGTLLQGFTNYFYAEAGYADFGSLTLDLFDVNGDLITSVLNGAPLGPHGRSTFEVHANGIAAFRISGNDTFGVAEIRIAPEGAGVPEPSTWALMIAGFGAAGAMLRRRRSALA